MKEINQDKSQLVIAWGKITEYLNVLVSQITYNTFIRILEPVDLDGSKLILEAPGRNVGDQIRSSLMGKFKTAIIQANISGITGFIVRERFSGDIMCDSSEIEVTGEEYAPTPIDSQHTFESYVTGNNQLVVAAAKSVAEHPGLSFNPLYIYGPTGLGKTHLMQAIANEIMRTHPSCNVVYTTCEKFTNQLIDLIASKSSSREKGQKFRAFYRGADVLIIDDIQFLEKKQTTQEEFFHTFNELTAANKQIILSSDCHPRDIPTLEARLRTRFESGLIADIQPPTIETKMAILKRKALEKKCPIPNNDVLEFLAQVSDNNVRTLEGHLNKVIFAARLRECEISLELAKTALNCSVPDKEEISSQALTAESIISGVCNFYGISKNDLIGTSKKKELVYPRQICVYLLHEMLSLPLTAIGKTLGGRDHTTILYSKNKVVELIAKHDKVEKDVSDIKNIILKK